MRVWNVDKVMHQSATKVELTQQILDDVISLMKQGSAENYNMVGALLPTIDWTKNYHLLWKLGQEIGTDLYMFNRNKDVQYWIHASGISDYYHMTALQMIQKLEEQGNLNSVYTRYVAEQHIREDCNNYIPSAKEWLDNIHKKKLPLWMIKTMKIND